MFNRRHYGENPWYLTDPKIEYYENEEDHYDDLYDTIFEDNIIEENQEFIDYEQDYMQDLLQYEQR